MTSAANNSTAGRGAGEIPAPPGLNWRHEHLRLKIGKNYYTFRTLSLLDAVLIEPHISPLLESVKAGNRPIEYARHLAAVTKVICPMMLDHAEDFKAIRAADFAAIVDFYRAQDWDRVAAVRALNETDAPDEEEDAPDYGPRAVFYAISAACAERCNMAVPDFLDSRLEFALDVMIAINAEYKAKKAEGKLKPGQFAGAMAAMLGAAEVDREDAPAWARDLADLADADAEG